MTWDPEGEGGGVLNQLAQCLLVPGNNYFVAMSIICLKNQNSQPQKRRKWLSSRLTPLKQKQWNGSVTIVFKARTDTLVPHTI